MWRPSKHSVFSYGIVLTVQFLSSFTPSQPFNFQFCSTSPRHRDTGQSTPLSRQQRSSILYVSPLIEKESSDNQEKSKTSSSKSRSTSSAQDNNNDEDGVLPLFDWDASGSIGALLMQMQKKEEELKKLNKTLLDKENSIDLSSPPPSSGSSKSKRKGTSTKNTMDEEDVKVLSEPSLSSEDELSSMDSNAAKELDDAVVTRISSNIGPETKIIQMPSLYKILLNDDEDNIDEEEIPFLSRPAHYHDRIGRDMRHLAVSIASCIDDVDEWRLFCQQLQPSGGLVPLIECIQEGADTIRARQDDNPTSDLVTNYFYEESFLAASSACRALRDLCDISQELAAVITDGLLRANVAAAKKDDGGRRGGPSFVEDLVTIIKYAEENTDTIAQSSWRKRARKSWRKRRRKNWPMGFIRRNEDRMKCKLYVSQLLLAMACSNDSALDVLRSNKDVIEILLRISSYNRGSQTLRWLRYPGELIKGMVFRSNKNRRRRRRPFIEAAALGDGLNGKVQGTANQVLAAIGYNQWVPKIPGQRGLRILCLDGGGSRGMTAVTILDCLVKSLGGVEAADCFDLIVGTSTGAIIAFLVALKKDSSEQAVDRYDELIGKIFTKSALSTPLLLFTTASYDESPFMVRTKTT